MSARKAVAEALTAAVKDNATTARWRVIASGNPPSNSAHPFVLVRQTTVKRTPGAPRLFRDHGVLLTLAVPDTDPATVEDTLEAALDELLDLLDGLTRTVPGGLTWQEASRVMLEDSYHAWDVPTLFTTEPA